MTKDEFIELVSSEQRQLRRFLLALCRGNSDDADDIAQETLVKAYLSLGDYVAKGKFRSWLYKIAHNTFLDYARKRDTLQPIDEIVQIPDTTRAADGAFEYQDLYMALDAISAKERSALLLFYINGYSVKEISAIVECSDDAVRKQLSRGREKLKKILKNGER